LCGLSAFLVYACPTLLHCLPLPLLLYKLDKRFAFIQAGWILFSAFWCAGLVVSGRSCLSCVHYLPVFLDSIAGVWRHHCALRFAFANVPARCPAPAQHDATLQRRCVVPRGLDGRVRVDEPPSSVYSFWLWPGCCSSWFGLGYAVLSVAYALQLRYSSLRRFGLTVLCRFGFGSDLFRTMLPTAVGSGVHSDGSQLTLLPPPAFLPAPSYYSFPTYVRTFNQIMRVTLFSAWRGRYVAVALPLNVQFSLTAFVSSVQTF